MTEPKVDHKRARQLAHKNRVFARRMSHRDDARELFMVSAQQIEALVSENEALRAENERLEARNEDLDKFAASMWESHCCADAKCETCRLYTKVTSDD